MSLPSLDAVLHVVIGFKNWVVGLGLTQTDEVHLGVQIWRKIELNPKNSVCTFRAAHRSY